MPIANQSLQKIAKGTSIVLIGTFVGLLLAFFTRAIIARHWTESDYGIFSLAYVVLNIAVVVSTLGLQQGATRCIAYARGKDSENFSERVQTLISSSILCGLLTSICVSVILFFSADLIATDIFHTSELAVPIKIFAFCVPFLTLINVLISIFRGFSDVKPKVYFEDLLRNGLFISLLLAFILFSSSFNCIFYAFLASIVVTCCIFVVYATKRLPFSLRFAGKTAVTNHITRRLLFFSIPLFGVSVLQMITAWTDTLMLGLFETPVEVGLYNIAHPLATFISFPLAALLVIHTPIISELYAQGRMQEMKRSFAIVTKWLSSITFPVFIILFLFPEPIIRSLFGVEYAPASTALRILSLGYMANNLLGPNGATLIALGESKFIMWATAATAVLNVGLNVILIPQFGINGAAFASIASMLGINCIRCWKLYVLSTAMPLTKNLLKPMTVSLVPITLVYVVFVKYLTVTYLPLLFILVLYYVIYGVTTLVTKSFDQEDIQMLLEIEKRTGMNATTIKKIAKIFL